MSQQHKKMLYRMAHIEVGRTLRLHSRFTLHRDLVSVQLSYAETLLVDLPENLDKPMSITMGGYNGNAILAAINATLAANTWGLELVRRKGRLFLAWPQREGAQWQALHCMALGEIVSIKERRVPPKPEKWWMGNGVTTLGTGTADTMGR